MTMPSTMSRFTHAGLILLLAGGAAFAAETQVGAGEVDFTAKPSVKMVGDLAKITFAVSAPTDVAVFIEDAQGKVVRHLAAGVLGTNAPAPFKPGSLAQEIAWDGKADYGKPATGAPYQVRVSLGLGAQSDRIFRTPVRFSGVCALGISPDGTLYVRHTHNPAVWGHSELVAINRDGSYQRTLLPFPSTPDNVASQGFTTLTLGGRAVPAELSSERDLFGGLGTPAYGATLAITPDGKTLYAPIDRVEYQPGGILRLSTEGKGCPEGKPIVLLEKPLLGVLPEFDGHGHVAVSSDGKSLFIYGARDRRGKQRPAAIFKVALPDRTGLSVFFGNPDKAGADAGEIGTTPGGICSDGHGTLLIADADNNRVVAVNETDGKQISELKVGAPITVGVSRPTQTLYVLSRSKDRIRLAKFASVTGADQNHLWTNVQKIIEMPLPPVVSGCDKVVAMAVDPSATPAVLWLACSCTGRRGYLARLEDQGETFKVTEISPGGAEQGYLNLTVDRAREEAYVRNIGFGEYWERYTTKSDKPELIQLPGYARGGGGTGTQLVPNPDGFLYSVKWRHGFWKWDRNGNPIVWPQPRTPTKEDLDPYHNESVPPPGPSLNNYARVGMVELPHTLGVRWSDGHIFVLEPDKITDSNGGRISKALHEYLPTGERLTTRDNPILWKVSDSGIGPKFDAAGNIYIAETVRPKGWLYPPEMKAYLKANGQAQNASSQIAAKMYGSIVKFTPKGGMIHFKDIDPFTGTPRLDPSLKTMDVDFFLNSMLLPVSITGAEWIHPGVGHVGNYACNCENITFDVDEFGRVFFPDTCMYQIRVIDTAGNPIATIGGYGNADNCGPNSAVIDPKTGRPRARQPNDPNDLKSPFAEPEIAMAWPTGVGVTDRHLYIADTINRRMLRTKVVYAAEACCAIPH